MYLSHSRDMWMIFAVPFFFSFFLKFIDLAVRVLVATFNIFSCSMWNLAPWPGIEPGPPILGVQSLIHWITRDIPVGSVNKCFRTGPQHIIRTCFKHGEGRQKKIKVPMNLLLCSHYSSFLNHSYMLPQFKTHLPFLIQICPQIGLEQMCNT